MPRSSVPALVPEVSNQAREETALIPLLNKRTRISDHQYDRAMRFRLGLRLDHEAAGLHHRPREKETIRIARQVVSDLSQDPLDALISVKGPIAPDTQEGDELVKERGLATAKERPGRLPLFLVDDAGPQNQGFAHRCNGWIEGWAIAVRVEPETLAEVAVGLIVPMVVPEAIHLGEERVSLANAGPRHGFVDRSGVEMNQDRDALVGDHGNVADRLAGGVLEGGDLPAIALFDHRIAQGFHQLFPFSAPALVC